ncbi:MAG: M23 family metallopeptidase [bacterium]|nr:M23 family metallopeptidase [bacterium]
MRKFIVPGIIGICLLAFGLYVFSEFNHDSTLNSEVSPSSVPNTKPNNTNNTKPVVNQTQSPVVQQVSGDKPPVLLKSIGINLDYYDPGSGRAGDFLFAKQNLQFNRLFMGYGFFIPSSSASPNKYNPQPTYILPLGTPVRSLVDGIVANMPTLWSGDYSIQVTKSGELERWVYETEHIINPKVKVGDKVKAGQIIGEVSNFDHGAPAGFGAVEIGILHGGGDGPPEHVCPFTYLDPSIKEEIGKKIIAFYKSWEEYVGDPTLYDESISTPGCLILDPIEG